jgi:hypothetical protein
MTEELVAWPGFHFWIAFFSLFKKIKEPKNLFLHAIQGANFILVLGFLIVLLP